MSAADAIRSAQARAGYYRRTEDMLRMAIIPPSTFYRKVKCGELTAAEIRRLDRVLKFRDEELLDIIRGK